MKSSILAIIIAVVVIGGAVAYSFSGGGLFQSTNKGGILEKGISELFDTKTFKVKGEIKADIKTPPGGLTGDIEGFSLSNIQAFIDMNSIVDQKKRDNFQSSSNFSLGIEADGVQITGTIDAITADKKIYIKIVSLPSLLLSFMSSLGDIQGRWMKVDFKALKEQYGGDVGLSMDDVELEEQIKALTDEIEKLLSEKTLFDIKKEYGEEQVGEITTNHYLLTANRDAIIATVNEYTELTKQYVPEDQLSEYEASVEKSLQGFPGGLDQFLTATEGFNIDVWVEKRGGRLVRLKWESTLSASADSDLAKDIESVDVLVDFTFSDFNKKAIIEVPENTEPIEEVLSGIITSFLPSSLISPEIPNDLPSGLPFELPAGL